MGRSVSITNEIQFRREKLNPSLALNGKTCWFSKKAMKFFLSKLKITKTTSCLQFSYFFCLQYFSHTRDTSFLFWCKQKIYYFWKLVIARFCSTWWKKNLIFQNQLVFWPGRTLKNISKDGNANTNDVFLINGKCYATNNEGWKSVKYANAYWNTKSKLNNAKLSYETRNKFDW